MAEPLTAGPPSAGPSPPGSSAPAELGSWRGEGVGLGRVLDALAELRQAEQRASTRTSVVNLVLVAADEDDAGRACAALHRLGARHPGRSVALVPRAEEAGPGIDATVRLHGAVAEGRAVWSEDVRLAVGGPARGHLDSLVEPLTLPDLPVAVWFVSHLPEDGDPLLGAADAVLVDSGPVDAAALASLVAIERRHALHDLCWSRLRPWRQVLAGAFEVPHLRPFVHGVRRVEAAGPAPARLLLAGWLAARLGLARSVFTLSEEDQPRLRLVADHHGDSAEVVAETAQDGTRVRLTARLAGRDAVEDLVILPEDPLAWCLADVLTHLGRDRSHGRALQAALGFAP